MAEEEGPRWILCETDGNRYDLNTMEDLGILKMIFSPEAPIDVDLAVPRLSSPSA